MSDEQKDVTEEEVTEAVVRDLLITYYTLSAQVAALAPHLKADMQKSDSSVRAKLQYLRGHALKGVKP